jgi:hypothetical protein
MTSNKVMELDKLHSIAAKATRKGGSLKLLTRFEWDVAGRCQRPLVRELHGRPQPKAGREIGVNSPDGKMTAVPMTGTMTFRCRKCEVCKVFRALQWRDRIEYELRQASRTWFGTLTCHPQIQWRMLLEARRRYDEGDGRLIDRKMGPHLYGPTIEVPPKRTFDELTADEQFSRHCDLMYREVQKYWKRIRKKNQAVFKYVVVFEKHTEKLAGFPHVHFLLHERSGAIKHRELSGEWSLGHTNFKLVEGEGMSNYLTKYLVKEASTRIRGSTDYGRDRTLLITAPGEAQRVAESEAQA